MAIAQGIITYVSAKLQNDIDKVLVERQDCHQRKNSKRTYHQPRATWETGSKDVDGAILGQPLLISVGKTPEREFPVRVIFVGPVNRTITGTYRNRPSTAFDTALSRVMSLRKAREQSRRHSPNPAAVGK